MKFADPGDIGDIGEIGGVGRRWVGRWESPDVKSTGDIGSRPIVRIDSASSNSETLASVERSEYEFRIDDTRIADGAAENRIVSESELTVDIVIVEARDEDMVEARSEPELEDVAKAMSYLCELQCMFGIDVD